ncbi:unnamed protein product [Linum trigynum]|uniref:Uncharacterized protein n=1 Tax=Linum trigynum TaxID=586398 RepID=A0AAV2EPA3_9ROSI
MKRRRNRRRFRVLTAAVAPRSHRRERCEGLIGKEERKKQPAGEDFRRWRGRRRNRWWLLVSPTARELTHWSGFYKLKTVGNCWKERELPTARVGKVAGSYHDR